MIRPECANCAPGDGQTRSVNSGVVLGVLGGMALIALLVVVVVPVARRQGRRRRRMGGREDVESGILPSRRSSSRHQKMQQLEIPAGPDVLLPLIDPVSTISWSDLRSKNTSVDSLQEAGLYSFRTDAATTSHPGLDDPDMDRGDTGRQQEVDDAQMSAGALKLSPTPPGLPSKIGASTAPGGGSYSSMPATSSDAALHVGMYPLSPVSPVFTMSRGASRSRPGTARTGMEPLIEDGTPSAGPPPLRQLPSPPSSPDQYEPNFRGSTTRRRPSTSLLSGTQSAHASTSTHRYPSLAVPASRSRASSVSLAPIPDLSPTERPTDAARRMSMSTTELRHRHPSSAAATQGSHSASHGTVTRSGTPSHGATHAGIQPRIPEYGEAGPSTWQRRRSMQLERSPPPFTGSPSPLSPPPSARPIRPLPVPGAPAGARPHSQSQSHTQHEAQSHQHLPPIVRKRDSPALRPLPASPFVQAGAVSRQSSLSAGTRTRSSSVMSERSMPRQLPPLAPLPPLEFGAEFVPDGDARSVRSRGK
ncbi:uncharacterized protein B0H18DRAFT_1122888 [Fomitopsis serialis]|uniref:uncharacterized protein n=1 Tax=Fomitopsis serialis TaxID=139415 RepID=UPI00200781EB|nr:uncharacterized protein B0H18DRAFT_1122888 [Neoantrodia serialis]KAH9918816.1 hypothetical protein B0H18DRAFT_1122888 [Neoantrodia serialis]